MKKFDIDRITEILGFIFSISIVIFFIFVLITDAIPTIDEREKFCADEVSRISSSYDLDEETSSGIVRVAECYLFNKGKFVKVDGVSFDVDTGVLYTNTNAYQGRTALYNPDGSLSTYKYYEIFLEVVKSLKESGLYG